MVSGLDFESHLHQLLHDDAPDLLSSIERSEVEIRGRIVRDGGRRPVRCFLEHEELGLAAGHHGKAQLSGALDLPFERGAGASGEGLLVRGVDVTEQPGHPAPFIGIGKDPEGVQVRLEEHVGLLDPDEPLDRGTIEHDLAIERLLELAPGYLDVLVYPQDIGELEPKKIDAEPMGQLEKVALPGPAQLHRESLQTRPFRHAGRGLLSLDHSVSLER